MRTKIDRDFITNKLEIDEVMVATDVHISMHEISLKIEMHVRIFSQQNNETCIYF